MGMMGILSAGDASVVVAVVMAVAGFFAARANRKDIRQINRAVNHVGPDEPTLIDRVRKLETNSERQDSHSRWMHEVIDLFAPQLGVQVPDHPDDLVHQDDEANR